MPKIRYLHKTREGISSIYPKKSGDILQNMNFSRYYRNRGKFIYGFDPNIIICIYYNRWLIRSVRENKRYLDGDKERVKSVWKKHVKKR